MVEEHQQQVEAGLKPSLERRVHDSVLGTIGWTPLVRLRRVAQGLECAVYAKLEYFNPGGSVKDRIGYTIIESYEQQGLLQPGGTVVEATSGNTGVGLAIVCALKGYQSVFVIPDKMSEEKIRLLRAFGARVVITPTAVSPEDPRSYYSVARRIVDETPNAVLANQYHNPVNIQSHYDTTAPEIWKQTEGRVTDIVVGMGTGGTITGIARYVRDNDLPVRIVGVDIVGSILYDAWRQKGSTEGLEATTYKVEGIGEDFIPTTLDLELIDDVVRVDDRESFIMTRRLVRGEGIFCGGSCGSAMAGAIKYAKGLGPDRLVVVIFPDSGSRYLSKVFNDDWMREHGFMETSRARVTAEEVARSRGLPTLITAGAQDRLTDVIARMREGAVSQLPVVNADGMLEGIVSEVELLDHMLDTEREHHPDDTIAPILNADVSTTMPDTPLSEVLPELLTKKVVVLTDDLRRPTGILTIIDALEYLSPLDQDETAP